MTKSEAIYRRVLRCRPGHSNAYVTTHEALLAEAEYLQRTPDVRTEPSDTAKFWMLMALATGSWGLVILAWWLS